jgi:hypothetical protein
MQIVHSLGGFARLSELSMEIPLACAGNVPLCQGCAECQKTRSVRVDVEFGGLSDDGCYAVDVANAEIRTKGAAYRFENGHQRWGGSRAWRWTRERCMRSCARAI